MTSINGLKCVECNINLDKYNLDNIILKVYETDNLNIIVLIKGEILNMCNIPLRIHSGCITGDIFLSKLCDCGKQLDYMLSIMYEQENGILIYIPEHEGRGIGIFNKIKAYKLIQNEHIDTYEANQRLGFDDDLRDFSFINKILDNLNVESVILYTNNPEKFEACKKYISKVENIPNFINESNYNYLLTKQNKKEHNLKMENYENIQKNRILINTHQIKICILYTKWNEKYVNLLKNAAFHKLLSLNFKIENIDFIEVPGSYDLLSGIDSLYNKTNVIYDAILLIGILLKGETSHYEFLMNALSYGIYQYQIKYNIPIVNGLLTCENETQIKNRSVNNNHGVFWANAILDMITSKYNTNFKIHFWMKHNNLNIFDINDNYTNVSPGKYICNISTNESDFKCTIKNNLFFVETTDTNLIQKLHCFSGLVYILECLDSS
jgi:6,7-dimethyl-8-ribityllumazine synthase